jgi:hypothetical protein
LCGKVRYHEVCIRNLTFPSIYPDNNASLSVPSTLWYTEQKLTELDCRQRTRTDTLLHMKIRSYFSGYVSHRFYYLQRRSSEMETAIWQEGQAGLSINRCSVRKAIIRTVLTANLRKYTQRQRDFPQRHLKWLLLELQRQGKCTLHT